jgi:hypothetical protein
MLLTHDVKIAVDRVHAAGAFAASALAETAAP